MKPTFALDDAGDTAATWLSGGMMVSAVRPGLGAFTPAQWMCVALFVFGLVMVAKVRKLKASGKDPMELVSLPRSGPLPDEPAYRQSA